MGKIVLARVDDRLVHGQVMTSWLNYLSANKIVVVDDQTAQDMLMKVVLSSVVPANIKLEVCTLDESVKVLNNLGVSDKVILLAKYPETMEKIIDMGVELPGINIGGMGSRPDRKTLYKWIAATNEERECLKRLLDREIDVFIQVIAEDKRLNLKDFLK